MPSGVAMQREYLDTIAHVERLHRQFLEVVKLELDTHGLRDINAVQAMILFNLGDQEMTVTELIFRGCYLGSNVSYNLKKLGELGYVVQERSEHDRRTIRVRLSEKGQALRQKLAEMHKRHIAALSSTSLTEEDLTTVNLALQRLDRFWVRMADVSARTAQVTSAT